MWRVFVAAHWIFDLYCAMWTLRCGMWDLVPWLGTEPRPLHLEHGVTEPPGKSPISFKGLWHIFPKYLLGRLYQFTSLTNNMKMSIHFSPKEIPFKKNFVISLNSNYNEQFFIFLVGIVFFYFCELPLYVFAHFPIRVPIFLLITCKSLYDKDSDPLTTKS